jgi:hypothetical protein
LHARREQQLSNQPFFVNSTLRVLSFAPRHLNCSALYTIQSGKIKNMRLAIFISKFLCIFSIMLLGSAAVFAQSSSDLRNKYGATWEAYEIRRNIWMNVIFGADNQACEMVIEALHDCLYVTGKRVVLLSKINKTIC